ncbi:aldo-keto reductase [Cavenderia fasciculata]|uniref:Aldo-keto reductase n=1 Tax=Cavenderia fasciculata TaxID=261658 RepID=F4QFR8_CACFS|nr:aldo-keto reductase [Cavenderia fasciculata]EGG14315.1 aldo-keto reductase [Cavenderia fasciculata]|eukprot:XP_004351024.1 aldo-keto reductase [Cavenderia fasciculata]
MSLTIRSAVTLANGVKMPLLGLGTYQISGDDIKKSVNWAIEDGYIHIDTAASYCNEELIGNALKEIFASGKIKREDLFIVSKAATSEHGYENAINGCERSLKKLGIDYLDLYLIHWPGVKGLQPSAPENSVTRKETWRAFEKLYQDKKCRSIGVSNYTIKHLEELKKDCTVVPHVNQVEFHPFLYQQDLLDYCKANNIALEAYSSLVRGQDWENPTLKEVASKLGKSVSQVLLRWAIQKGVVVIPKSTKQDRIKENADLYNFNIPKDLEEKLDALNQSKHICWDPNTVL